MADVSKHTIELKATLSYADADTRQITIENPSSITNTPQMTKTMLDTIGTITKGDKNGAAFSTTTHAEKVEKNVTTLDWKNYTPQ